MTVLQLAEHIAQHLKQLAVGHIIGYLARVFVVNGVPVESVLLLLVVEEAVVFVHYLPQSFKIATRIVGIFLLVYARTEREYRNDCHNDVAYKLTVCHLSVFILLSYGGAFHIGLLSVLWLVGGYCFCVRNLFTIPIMSEWV